MEKFMAKRDLYKVLFPKQRKALSTFGEDLLLAMKRRGLTKQMICDRTGFDHKTVSKVFAGDPGVAIGTYIKIMAVLGMEENFAKLAAHDEVGIKLQNIKLLGGSK
ncbi:XRE family transcriptional regulator [Acinetobacter sp. ANC 4635]|nr:XRE family transcriptional regulator [Acinetobacter sp. ANC 4635]